MSWQSWGWQCMPLLMAVGVGLSTFACLPLRAMAHPPINWGNPDSPARFWAVITAIQYRQFVGLLSLDEWFTRLAETIIQLGQQLSWSGLLLTIPGGYILWHSNRLVVGYLFSLVILTLLFRTSYPVMGNIVYLIPALYGLALLVGIGVTWLLTLAQKQIGHNSPGLLGLALFIAFGLRVVAIVPQVDASTDQEAITFSQDVLTTLPPKAVIMSDHDETTFSLWYRQASGIRPDVVIIDSRLLFYDWYRDNLTRHYPDLEPTALWPDKVVNLGRPVYNLAWPSKEKVIYPVYK